MNRLILLFTAIRTLFNTAYRMAYPFLGVFARGLGVDIETMSIALTARSVVGGITPLLAPVADNRGRKFGMLFGLGLFTVSTALVVFWPTFLVLTISLALTTLGKYIFDPAMQAYLGDRVPYTRRGLVIAITEAGWSMAFIFGVPLMGFIIARGGWMAPFPLLTLLGGLLFLGLFILLPKDAPPASANGQWDNFHTVLTSVPALAGLAVGFWASTANEVVNLIFGVWLEDSFGLQIAALGASAAVIGLSEFGGEGLVALFSDKLGKERAVALGLVANSLAALLLPLLAQSEVGALTGLFLFYITFEFTLVSSIPMMTEVLPSTRATLMAFNVASLSLGRALGAPLAPFLYKFGFPVVALGAVVFNVCALFSLRRMER
ncbi:MAG: MFS transporter [Chloroflexi bacterium]|nr:MFS transporter [Chloroflexota bacterium]